jgi:hypothetical protein
MTHLCVVPKAAVDEVDQICSDKDYRQVARIYPGGGVCNFGSLASRSGLVWSAPLPAPLSYWSVYLTTVVEVSVVQRFSGPCMESRMPLAPPKSPRSPIAWQRDTGDCQIIPSGVEHLCELLTLVQITVLKSG